MTSFANAAGKAASIYVALLVLMGFALTVLVIMRRYGAKVGIGDGGDHDLQRRIRVHGNFIEHMPAGFAVLILLPLMGAGALLVHVVGLMVLGGRILHAVGLGGSAGTSAGRAAGMVITNCGLIIGAIGIMTLAL